VKSATVKRTAMKRAAGEPGAKTTSAMAEAPTAVTTSAPAAVTTATASAAATTASQRRGRLRQADGQQRQQRDNRFPHHGSFLLDIPLPEHQPFRVAIIRKRNGKLPVRQSALLRWTGRS
jgi:hypothetical protein